MIRRALLGVLFATLALHTLTAQAVDVVIVAGQKVYHAAMCSETAAFNQNYLRTVQRSSLGPEFTACAVCRPDKPGVASSNAAPLAKELEELWGRHDATEMVSIVLGERTTGLYHRRGCHWLSSGATQTFSRKDADERYFQPHQECMHLPPGAYTAEAEAALRSGKPIPQPRTLIATPSQTGSYQAESSRTVSPRPARTQCAATTKKGTRCARLADEGSAFCWQHR